MRRRIGCAARILLAVTAGMVAGRLLVAVGGSDDSVDAAPLPPSVVRLRSERCGVTRTGLGVRLADGRTLTAAHVVSAAWHLDVGSRRAAPAAVSTSADVAVVDADDRGPGFELGRDARAGATVRMVDRQAGGWRSSAVLASSDGASMELSVTGGPGDSGGPVLDAGGRLVGLVVAVDPSTRRVRAIPASRLAEAIDGPLVVAPANRC